MDFKKITEEQREGAVEKTVIRVIKTKGQSRVGREKEGINNLWSQRRYKPSQTAFKSATAPG